MTLSDIKGIGAKRIEKLNKAGFYTPLDLLNHFPVRYIDARQDTVLREANDGDAVVVTGTPAETPTVRYVRRGLSMVRVRLVLDTGRRCGARGSTRSISCPALPAASRSPAGWNGSVRL